MNENTVTIPGKHTAIKTTTATLPTDHVTSHSTVMNFDQVKHLLSEKPLKSPRRQKRS